MTATELTFGVWARAIFPRMAGKLRPGVVIDAFDIGGRAVIVAVPATATRGAQPGALQIPEPPAPGLKPSRLLLPSASVLPADRFTPIGARLDAALAERLSDMMTHWFGVDWRDRDPALRPPYRGPQRLHPRSSSARRRDQK